jgi:hypothetical protein
MMQIFGCVNLLIKNTNFWHTSRKAVIIMENKKEQVVKIKNQVNPALRPLGSVWENYLNTQV